MKVASWGRLSSDHHEVVFLDDPRVAAELIRGRSSGLAYGMGRSYGDVCLNPQGILWNMEGMNRLVGFDRETGILRCEAGVLLRDIQETAVRAGWMLPVTPGTQIATVGGAIANDVHGKNHHGFGSFGDHVREIVLARTDGEIIACGPDARRDWFRATVGGIGLSGVILEAEIQLRRVAGPWIDGETVPFQTLGEFFRLSDESESAWEHTVAWIDCSLGREGRGLFMRGNHSALSTSAPPLGRGLAFPFVPPVSAVNRLTHKPFNAAYYHLKAWKAGRKTERYETFFYPLDHIHAWNRMYGPRGFFQYQCVAPRVSGLDAVAAILREAAKAREGSFLAVIKTFGTRMPLGMLSFPRPGVTLALDFPNHGEKSLNLFARLDRIVLEAGGRLYLAKDARMPRAVFEAGYPEAAEFLKYRDAGLSSSMSRRLMGG